MTEQWDKRKARIAADPEFAARVRKHSRECQRRRRAILRSRGKPECPFRTKNGRHCWRPMPHDHRTY